EESSVVKTGTIFRLHWPQAARCLSDAKDAGSYNAHRLLRAYATFNPHALFEMQASGQTLTVVPTDRQWQKWRPDWPTTPHWYTPEAFRTLIGAYIAEERRGGRVRTVREFVAEFDGLTGSIKQKKVVELAGLSGLRLHDLVEGDDVQAGAASRLL